VLGLLLGCNSGDDVDSPDGAADTDAEAGTETEGDPTGCVSSTAATPECRWPGPGFECPHIDHVCGFVGANKQTMTPTCVCLEDPDACYPSMMELPCVADRDCDGAGDAICVNDICVCAP